MKKRGAGFDNMFFLSETESSPLEICLGDGRKEERDRKKVIPGRRTESALR